MIYCPIRGMDIKQGDYIAQLICERYVSPILEIVNLDFNSENPLNISSDRKSLCFGQMTKNYENRENREREREVTPEYVPTPRKKKDRSNDLSILHLIQKTIIYLHKISVFLGPKTPTYQPTTSKKKRENEPIPISKTFLSTDSDSD